MRVSFDIIILLYVDVVNHRLMGNYAISNTLDRRDESPLSVSKRTLN